MPVPTLTRTGLMTFIITVGTKELTTSFRPDGTMYKVPKDVQTLFAPFDHTPSEKEINDWLGGFPSGYRLLAKPQLLNEEIP
jgi:hypothetical protein